MASRPFDACATRRMSSWSARMLAMPWRRRGWSSTNNIRIALWSVLITSPFLEYNERLQSEFNVGHRGIDDTSSDIYDDFELAIRKNRTTLERRIPHKQRRKEGSAELQYRNRGCSTPPDL